MRGLSLRQSLAEGYGKALPEFLFMSLAEELKLPFQQIARRAELEGMLSDPVDYLKTIQTTADMSLQLIDCYLLSLRLAANPEERFDTEPIAISAILHDTSLKLSKMAEQYDVDLSVHANGYLEPVLVHNIALRSAFVALGYTLIEALPAMTTRKKQLHLIAHRTRAGVVAGMYCDVDELTPKKLRQAYELYGLTRQPMPTISPNAGAGVFVANSILQAMSSTLRTGRYKRLPGFVVTLPESKQLSLV